MKIKIQGWPLCVLVLALQQLMTLVFFSSRLPPPLSSALCCQPAFSEESHFWFVWWYIFSLYSHCWKKTFENNPVNSARQTPNQGWPLYVLVLALRATADDISSFFPADSHLHFPVYCVVSRPFQRKATCDSSDDRFSLNSQTFNFSLI